MESRNPLEQWPNLFANGEFSVRHEDYNTSEMVHRKIMGLGGKYLILRRSEMMIERDLPRNCILIVRPIEDMTDGEKQEFRRLKTHYAHLDSVTEYLEYVTRSHDVMSYSIFEFLNDRGFYHFDQAHFEDGIVIDSREI